MHGARRAATVSPLERPSDAPTPVAPGSHWRVRGSTAFAALQRSSARARRGPVWVAFVSRPGARPRVAFAVGRRAGSAVVRNRIRRRLRAVLLACPLPEGDLLVGAGAEAASLPYEHLELAVNRAVASATGTGAVRARQ